MNFSCGAANLYLRDIVDRKIKDLATFWRSRFTSLALISLLQNQPGTAKNDHEQKQDADVSAFHERKSARSAALSAANREKHARERHQRGHRRDVHPLEPVFQRVDIGSQFAAFIFELRFDASFFFAEAVDLLLLLRRKNESLAILLRLLQFIQFALRFGEAAFQLANRVLIMRLGSGLHFPNYSERPHGYGAAAHRDQIAVAA